MNTRFRGGTIGAAGETALLPDGCISYWLKVEFDEDYNEKDFAQIQIVAKITDNGYAIVVNDRKSAAGFSGIIEGLINSNNHTFTCNVDFVEVFHIKASKRVNKKMKR